MLRSLVVVLIVLPLLSSPLRADLVLKKAFPEKLPLMAQVGQQGQPKPALPHYTMTASIAWR